MRRDAKMANKLSPSGEGKSSFFFPDPRQAHPWDHGHAWLVKNRKKIYWLSDSIKPQEF